MSDLNDTRLTLPALIRSRVAAAFRLGGRAVRVEPLAAGLINRTFRLTTCGGSGQGGRYLVQIINAQVFPDPGRLMSNLQRVCDHLEQRVRAEHRDWERRVLSPVRTLDGGLAWIDDQGRWWRAFRYVKRSLTRAWAADAGTAYRAAEAFGSFVRQLSDLPPPPLHTVLPGFHDTPARLGRLLQAIEADPRARAADSAPEVERILARQTTARALADAGLPERVVHNDTKISNVLFDRDTREALCVVDLDTVMPGLALHDFGDLVRSAAASAPEDSPAALAPSMRMSLYEALLKGWVHGLGPSLTRPECGLLATAPRVIALELAARFLTDHLEGDRYFAITRPGQNLARCRSQLHLLQSMETQGGEMERLAREATAGPLPDR